MPSVRKAAALSEYCCFYMIKLIGVKKENKVNPYMQNEDSANHYSKGLTLPKEKYITMTFDEIDVNL